MFGREQGRDLDAGGQHQIDIAPAVAAHAGLIGDQADPFAAQCREIVFGQDVQAGEHLGLRFHLAVHARADDGLVVAGEFHARGRNSERRRHDGRDAAAQRSDGMAAVRMHGVGQDDHVGAAERVDPERSAGESGVAVGADREQFAAIAGIGRIDVPAQAAQNRLVGGRLR